MEAMEAILSRRSIRKYTSVPVTEMEIEELLRAAMSAPSAGNEQPWHFVVITARHLLDAIPAFHANAAMLRQATAAVLVCGDPRLQKYEGFWTQDCAAATENLLIAASAKRLGAVWLGIHPRVERIQALQKLLGIPEQVIPFSLIALGHPDENKPASERYEPTRVHLNQW